jgi:hypothetical protein
MLIPKKALKTRRRELSIADGVLDRLVAQIALDGMPQLARLLIGRFTSEQPSQPRAETFLVFGGAFAGF